MIEIFFYLLAGVFFGITLTSVISFFICRFIISDLDKKYNKEVDLALESMSDVIQELQNDLEYKNNSNLKQNPIFQFLGKIKGSKINRIPIVPDEVIQLQYIDNFKSEIDLLIEKKDAEAEFEESHRLQTLSMNNDDWFGKRKKWFYSKIGETVYISETECNCESCSELKSNGVLLKNKEVAFSIFALENSWKIIDKKTTFVNE